MPGSSPRCLTDSTLVRLAEGKLEAKELALAQAHIDECETCLTLFLDMARPDGQSQGSAWAPPQQFDDYRLGRLLGRGGMGLVYLGHDTLLDRAVAIKFIASGDPEPQERQRFRTEARALARLSHPNVIDVHRVGEVQGRPYLVTEYLRGPSLAELPKPLPWPKALEIGLCLARGLSAAHRQGVLHRDIKPQNVKFTGDGEVKLLDFGLAKLRGGTLGPVSSLDAQEVLAATQDAPITRSASAGVGIDRALTRGGTRMGTYPYASPEVWERGEPASRRSDVYSLGVVLCELCTGRAPEPPQPNDPTELPAPGDVPAALWAIIARCLQEEPARRYASGEELRDALSQILVRPAAAVLPAGNPYRGLSAFDAAHRDLFFGRGTEVRALVERLRAEPLVLLAGDSGVGKSSLCRAGALPLVVEGAFQDGRAWSVLRVVPGHRPLAAVAAVVAPLLGSKEEALAAWFRSDPAALSRELRHRQGTDRGVLLFMDQMEELFTVSDPAEVAPLGELLAHLSATAVGGIRVLLAVRGDFLIRLAALPGVGAELGRALHVLGPLSPEGTREAIVGPAQALGVRFESEALVDELSASYDCSGGLPLLQFALAELWEARDAQRQLIPAAALQRLGGVASALSRHADGVIAGLLPVQRNAARRILLRLVSAEGTRVRRARGELCRDDDGAAALEALVRGRLLCASEAEAQAAEAGGDASYEVAHEALIAGWVTLRGWLDADGEGRAVRARLEGAAAEWQRLGRPPEALWGGRQLAEVRAKDLADSGSREDLFLAASHAHERRRRRTRWLLLLGAPLLLLLSYGASSLRAWADRAQITSRHLGEADAALIQARAKSAEADRLRGQAFSRFDAGEAEAGEREWAGAKGPATEARAAYQAAGRALEQAVLLDSHRAPVRRRLAEVLYEQALLAERAADTEQMNDLIQRMATYDDEGALRRRLTEEARLSIDSQPRGAVLTVQRYGERGGSRRPGPPILTSSTPVSALALAPGSYLITLSAPGRAKVRYPVLLGRGERHQLALDLPAAVAVPDGFVYIPPGRFLLGSADEGIRSTLYAQPQHETRTGAYLIGRTEVTMGQWLEFLRALPAAERARLRPQAGPTPAAISIEEDSSGGVVLRFSRGGQGYAARAGEPLRYQGRTRRADQDWLRFPVVGVSYEDGLAYTAWLRRSGRLPGARLCDEREWERAARGADDRLYPHGDQLSPDDANYDEAYGRNELAFGPDEAGAHPASDSPFGVADLSGNAWEWTASAAGTRQIIYRGGSWYNGEISALVANRAFGEPTLRHVEIGLRICAALPLVGPLWPRPVRISRYHDQHEGDRSYRMHRLALRQLCPAGRPGTRRGD